MTHQDLEPRDDELLKYLMGELAATRVTELTAWIQRAPEHLARVDELRAMLAALSHVEPTEDLVAGVEAAIARDQPRRQHGVPWRLAAGAALAAAACVALVWAVDHSDSGGLRVKGAAASTDESWAGVRAYRVERDGGSAALGERLRSDEGLLFAYSNGGPSPYTHLLIFGVSSGGQVYWYYPAWLDLGDDPAAIPIHPSKSPVELHEQVTHALPPGPLALHAVFARRPIRVSEVERALRSPRGTSAAPLPLADTAQQRVMVDVVP